jgi:MBG domain (YGX type)
VTPATLTIHPLPGEGKVYGAPMPALFATATGFVNGDPSSLLTEALVANSGAGSYFFTPGTLNAGRANNVVIAPFSPIFTVNPACW